MSERIENLCKQWGESSDGTTWVSSLERSLDAALAENERLKKMIGAWQPSLVERECVECGGVGVLCARCGDVDDCECTIPVYGECSCCAGVGTILGYK